MSADNPIKYNDEQVTAIGQMREFLAQARNFDLERSARPKFFTFKGPAGTGKTTCAREVGSQFKGRMAYSAPTNKAVKVLRESGVPGRAATIFSLLGLRLEANGEVKELKVSDGGPKLSEFDAVMVDEGSMLGARITAEIVKAQEQTGIPFIFMGDPYQLPPVKEVTSPIWTMSDEQWRAELVKVMRHDNQILKLATHLRTVVASPLARLSLDTNYDDAATEGVKKFTAYDQFLTLMLQYAREGKFTDGRAKAIAWRNSVVDKLNWRIRDEIMGVTPLPFEVGDRIIATEPAFRDQQVLMVTDEEGMVEKVTEMQHPWHPAFRIMALEVKKEEGGKATLWAVHPDTQKDLQEQINAHAKAKEWRKFWSLKEAFHAVKPSYAITSHRSQGSTYESTFVNFADILYNPNRAEAMRCLYVACTRSKKQLFLTGG